MSMGYGDLGGILAAMQLLAWLAILVLGVVAVSIMVAWREGRTRRGTSIRSGVADGPRRLVMPAAVAGLVLLVVVLVSVTHAQETQHPATVGEDRRSTSPTPADGVDPDFQTAADQALARAATMAAMPQTQALTDMAGDRIRDATSRFSDTADLMAMAARASLARGFAEVEPVAGARAAGAGGAGAMISALQTPAPRPAGAVYLAVSFAMPGPALRRLATDAHKAGVAVVLRGLVDNSFVATRTRLSQTFQPGDQLGVTIDPKVFAAFGIQRTPTFIAAAEPVRACPSLDCTVAPPPSDQISGNISLAAALRALATAGGPGAAAAQAALDRLETS